MAIMIRCEGRNAASFFSCSCKAWLGKLRVMKRAISRKLPAHEEVGIGCFRCILRGTVWCEGAPSAPVRMCKTYVDVVSISDIPQPAAECRVRSVRILLLEFVQLARLPSFRTVLHCIWEVQAGRTGKLWVCLLW